MIKDIVVNLSVGPTRDVATDFAVSMAGIFEAHLAGIAFRYNEKAAKTAIDRLDEAAKRAGISTESRMSGRLHPRTRASRKRLAT